MGKSKKHGALKELEGIINRFAGEDIGKKVMESSEEMTEQMRARSLLHNTISASKDLLTQENWLLSSKD